MEVDANQPAVSEADDAKLVSIEFSGSANEYFGIWIVNVLLTLVTLGIYSAWAKVRRLTYFRNQTRIAGYGFGYHATGIQILKGRIIAIVVIVLISFVSNFFPVLAIPVSLAFLFVIPWALNASMRFSARMTSYRNVRFNWHGTYWKSFWFFVIAPALGVLSIGLLVPLIFKHYYKYFAEYHSYGTTRFSAAPTTGSFYAAFLWGVVLPAAVIIGLGLVISILAIPHHDEMHGPFPAFVGVLFILVPVTIVFLMTVIYSVLCRNLMVRTLTLSDVAEFDSDIHPIRIVWISLTNLIAIVGSLGLLLPWATVRIYRYITECTKIKLIGDIDKFVDDAISSKSAFGEEFAEFEGIDLGI